MNKKILVQFPTKGRTSKFFETLDRYIAYANNVDDITFHVVIDHFDYSMNNSTTLNKLASYNNVKVSAIPENPTKIKACNYNIKQFDGLFDILVLASDDMIPQIKGWDDVIRMDMEKYYPNLDGCLWYNDGYRESNLCTLSILGARYYKRFGYIYHPDYKTMWADNEYTIVAQKLNRITYINNVIIKHEHPDNNTNIEKDDLYVSNDTASGSDSTIFNRRRLHNFGLNI